MSLLIHSRDLKPSRAIRTDRLVVKREWVRLVVLDIIAWKEISDDAGNGILLTPLFFVTQPWIKWGEVIETGNWLRIGHDTTSTSMGDSSTLYKAKIGWYLDLWNSIPTTTFDYATRYSQIQEALLSSGGKVEYYYESGQQSFFVISSRLFWFTYWKSGAWDLSQVSNIWWNKTLENIRVTYKNGWVSYFNLDRGQELGFASDWQNAKDFQTIYFHWNLQ